MGINERKALAARRATRNERIVKASYWARQRGLKVAGVLVVLVALVFSVRFALQKIDADHWIVLKQVELNGNQMLTWEEILAAGEVEIGMPMWGMPVDSIAERISKLNLVRSVQVEREIISTLRIDIQEVEAILSVFERKGERIISDKGTPIPSRENAVWQVPILVDASKKNIERSVKMLNILKQAEPWLYSQVSQISYPANLRGVEFYMRNVRHKVWFSFDATAQDFINYRVLLQAMSAELIGVELVDMRFNGQAIARFGSRENIDG